MENIILIAVTVFLAYKLYEVLGKHGPDDSIRQPAPLPKEKKPAATVLDVPVKEVPAKNSGKAAPALARLKKALPEFDEAEFLENATAAFEMIIKAFTRADAETLKKFLEPGVLKNFESEIKALQKKKYQLSTQIVKIHSVRLKNAEIDKKAPEKAPEKVHVTVEFVSDQISVVKDEENRIQEGDPHTPEKITDVWTFSKPLKSADPTWYLSSTDA